MILEVIRHIFASIQASFQLSMGDVASHDDSTFQIHACAHRILRKFCAHSIDTLVKVDFDARGAFARVAQFLWYQFGWVAIHLLKPYTVLVNLRFDVTVCRAAYAHTDRTACSVTRQTNHTHVMCQSLTAKLGTQSNLVSLLKELVFQVDVAESASCFIARCRQVVVVFD